MLFGAQKFIRDGLLGPAACTLIRGGPVYPYGGPGRAMHTPTSGWAQQRILDALLRPAWQGGMMRGARRCMVVHNARQSQQNVPDDFLDPEIHAGRAARPRNLSACFCRPNFHHEPRRYLGTVHGLFWFYDIDFGARYSLCLKVYCKVDPKAPEQFLC